MRSRRYLFVLCSLGCLVHGASVSGGESLKFEKFTGLSYCASWIPNGARPTRPELERINTLAEFEKFAKQFPKRTIGKFKKGTVRPPLPKQAIETHSFDFSRQELLVFYKEPYTAYEIVSHTIDGNKLMLELGYRGKAVASFPEHLCAYLALLVGKKGLVVKTRYKDLGRPSI